MKIYKEHIKTGDCLLVSSYSWLAKQIQKFQDCKWNHAGMFIWIGDVLYICESYVRGICLTPFSDYENSKKQLMVLRPTFKYDTEILENLMLSKCGHVPYDFVNLIIHQSIKYITGKRIWIGKREQKADKRFICGEWCAYCYHMTTEKNLFPEWNKIAPEELYNDEEHFVHFDLI